MSEERVTAASLRGAWPDMTGGMCSVDYVRWGRDYEPHELDHPECARIAREWDAVNATAVAAARE